MAKKSGAKFLSMLKAKSKQKNGPLAKAAKDFEIARAKSQQLWNKAVKESGKNKGVTNALTTALANIFCNYILKKELKFSPDKCVEFIRNFQHKSECVVDGLTTYDDIEKYEIKSTNKEFYPIKWVDYEPYVIKEKVLCEHMEKAVTDKEFINKYKHALAITYGNDLFGARELLYLSTLHQYYGIGLVRCKRFVEKYRDLQFSTPKEVWDMVAWLERNNLGFDDRDMEYFTKYEKDWHQVLKPKGMKEEKEVA